MLNRSIVLLLALNLFWVKVQTAAINREVQAEHEEVDKLLNGLQQGVPQQQTSSQTVTTSTVSTSQNTVDSNQHVAELLKDPNFVAKLLEFLRQYQFLLNSQGSSSQSVQYTQNTQTQEASVDQSNADLKGLLNNPSFVSFLTSFFLQNQQGSTLASQTTNALPPTATVVISQSSNVQESETSSVANPEPSSSQTSQVSHVSVSSTQVNGHSRPVPVETEESQVVVALSGQEQTNTGNVPVSNVVSTSHVSHQVQVNSQNQAPPSQVSVNEVQTSSSSQVSVDPASSDSAAIDVAYFQPPQSQGAEVTSSQVTAESQQVQTPSLEDRFGGNNGGDNAQVTVAVVAPAQSSGVSSSQVISTSRPGQNQAVIATEALLAQLGQYLNKPQEAVRPSTAEWRPTPAVPQVPISTGGQSTVWVTTNNNVANSKPSVVSGGQTIFESTSHSSQVNVPQVPTNAGSQWVFVNNKPSVVMEVMGGPSSSVPLPTNQVNNVQVPIATKPLTTGRQPTTSSFVNDVFNGAHQQQVQHQEEVYNEEEEKRMAQNAKYQFATQVNDGINGNFQERAEIREGTRVYGKYSSDDGFQRRTVYYEADENGYRVTREDVEPSQVTSNANGVAQVQTLTHGNLVNYQITRKDIHQRKPAVNAVHPNLI